MEIQKQHWVEFLSEVGRPIQRLGSQQLLITGKIRLLENQISQLKLEYADNEIAILGVVAADWTDEEINEAKFKAKCLI